MRHNEIGPAIRLKDAAKDWARAVADSRVSEEKLQMMYIDLKDSFRAVKALRKGTGNVERREAQDD